MITRLYIWKFRAKRKIQERLGRPNFWHGLSLGITAATAAFLIGAAVGIVTRM